MIIHVASNESWQIDKHVRLCISHIRIINLVLIFMYLAVITTQHIKQYQIPDLLTKFSACNKPF